MSETDPKRVCQHRWLPPHYWKDGSNQCVSRICAACGQTVTQVLNRTAGLMGDA